MTLDAAVQLAERHGYAVMPGKRYAISATMQRTEADGTRHYLLLEGDGYRHDIQYANGFGRQLHGQLDELAAYLAKPRAIAPSWQPRRGT